MFRSPKCHREDDKTVADIHFETWTGKESPISYICALSSRNQTEHVVGVANWKGYPVSVTSLSESIGQTISFIYPRGSGNAHTKWERNQANPIQVPAAPPNGSPQLITDAAHVQPNNVANRPNQIVKVKTSYKPHLPGAQWVKIPSIDILVDVK